MEISVARGSRSEHRVSVSTPGVITWRILICSGGVDASAIYVPTQGEPEVVLPKMRISPSEGSTYAAMSVGELVFTFDNPSLMSLRIVKLEVSKEDIEAARAGGRLSPAAGLNAATDATALSRLAIRGVRDFFNNRYTEAELFFETERLRVPVFAISHATLAWLRAIASWDTASIVEAKRRLATTIAVANAYLPVTSANDGVPLTGLPLEATLIQAEALLLSALLSLMEESLLSLAKCALSIRSGHQLYGVADRALGGRVMKLGTSPQLSAGATINLIDAPDAPSLTPAAELEANVEDGLLFGLGGFNCVASLLPPVILRILSAVGFPFSRESGLSQLRECCLNGRVRSPLAGLLLLGMRVILPSFHSGALMAHGEEAGAALDALLTAFPNSALPLWMGGRLYRMQARLNDAEAAFRACASFAGGALQQLDDLSLFELTWVEAARNNWAGVTDVNTSLLERSSWSKAFYAYVIGVARLQTGQLAAARESFVSVLSLSSRRLGGRIIPAEQFAVKRASEYVALTLPPVGDGGELPLPPGARRVRLPAFVAPGSRAHAAALTYPAVLPGLELFYYFGGFSQMPPAALHAALGQVDAVLMAAAEASALGPASAVYVAGAAGEGSNVATAVDVLSAVKVFETGKIDEIAVPDNATAPLRSAVAVVALLDRAMAASSSGGSTPEVPRPSTFSFLRAAVSSAVATGVSTVTSVGAALGVGAASAPMAPKVIAPAPINAVALAALLRGAICGVLCRTDEASAALEWVSTNCMSSAALTARDVGITAYAPYEEALLALDVLEARRAAALGFTSDYARGSTRERCTLRDGAVLKSALAAALLTTDAAAAAAMCLLKRARGVTNDFPWRVRLHIRVHLATGEVRESLTGATPARAAKGEWVAGGRPNANDASDDDSDGGGPEDAASLAALAAAQSTPIEEE